jgi:hypothetical protein
MLAKILGWSFFVRYLLFGHYVPSSRIAIRCENVGVVGQKPEDRHQIHIQHEYASHSYSSGDAEHKD